jgi:DNA helicase IV
MAATDELIPSKWSGKDWDVTVTNTGMTAVQSGRTITVSSSEASRLEARRRWFRWSLYDDGRPAVRLRGINRADAAKLRLSLRVLALTPEIADALSWRDAVTAAVDGALADQRWLPTEVIEDLERRRPATGLAERIRHVGVETAISAEEVEAAAFVGVDLESLATRTNERVMESELVSRRPFFDSIEKTALTDEQARAVVCFDNRVQVLAAAGSGKTSVMVARAAYAVSRGFISPDRILLLAFNRNAAKELQERIEARFAAAGIPSDGIRASTFHSFGLDVIGRATGKKPRLAKWIDEGEDARMVLRIVDELRDASETFRYRWDLYRLLFAHAPTKLETHEPDGYDTATRQNGYRTFGGDIVKSHSERLIADFLCLNGVEYEYERPYSIDVADASHSQYRPDFYYPTIDVWHEHWALDQHGNPPAEFEGYASGISWKRDLHSRQRTQLIETTWGDVMFGDGLEKLQAELTGRGVALDWNPDRPLNDAWAKPMKHEDLARFVRTFMAHVKSNSWTREALESRLTSELNRLNGFRSRLFLDIYWEIHAEWERRLAEDHAVDFEDMLVQAADHLEARSVDCPFDLIMVDEFQDASRARARLVRGLLQKPGRYLLAVGDDWQSINRFAGADLSVMTGFHEWFGRGHQLPLTTTFRCTQTICDVASAFVSKNPNQFQKPMRSTHGAGAPVRIIRSDDSSRALADFLHELSEAISSGDISPGAAGKVSVDVLGRYRFERDVLPRNVPVNLQVTFRTVHGSKGLEADFVVVPGMATGTYGFPSTIADDPVLDLAMPAPEDFEHAEERRLFYVALTRARRGVVLITPAQRMSPFVIELLQDPNVLVDGAAVGQVEVCGTCKQGVMVERRSRFGPFLSCSRFPACTNKRNIPRPAG